MQELFASLLANGRDLRASVALTINGEMVVDLWGGWTDEARTRPWQSDTIVNVWSTTKPMTSLVALMLADRGELDLDAPLARYWPEFGANGKGAVTMRHVMSHASGVPGWEKPLQIEDLFDWERCTYCLLAAQAPWWPPGTASGYHALNYGFLVGEVVRRITGHKTGRFFADNIARPLGADCHIGLANSDFHRVANVVPPVQGIDVSAIPTDTVAFRTLSNPALDARASWTEAWRRADLGACNGHGNARSVASVQTAVANGGEAGGVRLLSARTVEQVFEPQVEGVDLVLGAPMTMGLGYGLPCAIVPFIPAGWRAFWGGWGGSLVIADADNAPQARIRSRHGPPQQNHRSPSLPRVWE